MLVEVKRLTNAIKGISSIAGDTKNVVGILLSVGEAELKVKYADGQKAFEDCMPLKLEDGDEGLVGDIIVPYDKMVSVIDKCAAKGRLVVDNLQIKQGEGNLLKIKCIKYFLVQTGAVVENGDGVEEEEVIKKKGLEGNYEITYSKPGENLREAILTRVDYGTLVSEKEDADVWNKQELIEVLKKLSNEDGKVIYVSAKEKKGYVANTGFMSIINLEDVEANGFSIITKAAKAVLGVLSRMSGESIEVKVLEKLYCVMTDADTRESGLMFNLGAGLASDVALLETYKQKDFTTNEIILNKDVLANALDGALMGNVDTRATLEFVEKDDVITLQLKGKTTDSTKRSDYEISVVEVVGDRREVIENKIEISLDVLNKMVRLCDGFYISLKVNNIEGQCIKISDIVGKEEEEVIYGSEHYAITARE